MPLSWIILRPTFKTNSKNDANDMKRIFENKNKEQCF
jgi:hypothetical protein